MLPSFHDDYLIGYEVDCEAREIKLHIQSAVSDGEQAGVSTVVFTGVQGYHFLNDAFGNIILDLEAVPLTWFVSQYRDELAESFRMSGAPGTWASDLDDAAQLLSQRGIQAFVLSPSLGLSGWVLAKEASVMP
jgi:hypothetical protein